MDNDFTPFFIDENICYDTSSNNNEKSKSKTLLTQKRRKMDNDFTPTKKTPNFHCELCDFKCSKNSDWERHLLSKKHNGVKKRQIETSLTCVCGNTYKFKSGLAKHKKVCAIETNIHIKNNELIDLLLQQNNEFKEMILEQNKNMINSLSSVVVNNTNNINSNNRTSFNLQFFLNEKCKNAFNLSDFMNSIQLDLIDLENVGKLGYVEGISNIIISKLKAMDIYSRPIHCADSKREIIYIKENDIWTKEENDNTRLRKTIKDITFRNCKNFHLFKEKHPDCVKCDSVHSDNYVKIVSESIGGRINSIADNENKIIRKIAREMYIDKSNYLAMNNE
jgi:hypothetical protein